MTNEKWIGRSRGLWAQVLLAITAAIGLAKGLGVEIPENIVADIDAVGVAGIGLAGALLALWSRLRPSTKMLRAAPNIPLTEIGGPA